MNTMVVYPHDLQVFTMSPPFLAGISSTINLLYDKKGLPPIPCALKTILTSHPGGESV